MAVDEDPATGLEWVQGEALGLGTAMTVERGADPINSETACCLRG